MNSNFQSRSNQCLVAFIFLILLTSNGKLGYCQPTLDGKKSNLEENDVARRNTIATLMSDWGLISIEDKTVAEPLAPMRQIKIIPFKEKNDWELCPKYNIGRK